MRAAIAFAALSAFALIASPCSAHIATPAAPMTFDEHDCRFSPEIERALALIPTYSDMQEHIAKRPARFGFGRLHVVGVANKQDAEMSEATLYFREDIRATREVLRRMGLHVDKHGEVAAPKALEDAYLLYVRVRATGPRGEGHFPRARSYLVCGSL